MYNVTVGRFAEDPDAQGVVRADDGSWQVVIDRDGYPHLYVRVKAEGEDVPDGKAEGLMCIEDLLPDDMSIRSIAHPSDAR